MLPPLNSGNRMGVSYVEVLASFFVAVAAGVVCNLICKWLDRNDSR